MKVWLYFLYSSFKLQSFFKEGKILLKNCYSDIPASTRQLCDESDYIDCKKCNGNDCNTALTRDGIKCHQCSGIDCLVIENVANLVDCHSSCYIGINRKFTH